LGKNFLFEKGKDLKIEGMFLNFNFEKKKVVLI